MRETQPIHSCLLKHLGAIALSGEDAATFLQGQSTCDTRLVTPSRSGLGALCTPKGRVIADFRLIRTNTDLLLLLNRDLLEPVLKRLRMYVLRSRVTLADVSETWHIEGLIGAGLGTALTQLGLALPDEVDGVVLNESAMAVRVSGEPARCLLLQRHDELATQPHNLSSADAEIWRLADIANGLPHIGANLSEAFIPQMLNLDLIGAVSFHKGCYTGQEIVARTHYLGKAKRRTYRYAVASTPCPGDALYAEGQEETAGTVVNVVGGEFLAVVACEYGNAPLRLGKMDGPLIQPLPLPYQDSL